MSKQKYRKQVNLLLKVLPEVSRERGFALHGGTAINLFYRNMPRLSVDIDLTWCSTEERSEAFTHIVAALQRIKKNLERVMIPDQITLDPQHLKLLISLQGASVKVEVNPIKRGCYTPPVERELCARAQQEFDAFCIMPVVERGLLFGGKICAALDRQHPRDLFDVKWLLDENGWNEAVQKGSIFYLISGNRPLVELLYPHFTDQSHALETQFTGMADRPFSYPDFEETRSKLLEVLYTKLTEKDKQFLWSVENGTPDWTEYNFQEFPAVKWKLQNIEKFKKDRPEEHLKLMKRLEHEFTK